jgi:hypothetical protein
MRLSVSRLACLFVFAALGAGAGSAAEPTPPPTRTLGRVFEKLQAKQG